jgi:hypothetical protein
MYSLALRNDARLDLREVMDPEAFIAQLKGIEPHRISRRPLAKHLGHTVPHIGHVLLGEEFAIPDDRNFISDIQVTHFGNLSDGDRFCRVAEPSKWFIREHGQYRLLVNAIAGSPFGDIDMGTPANLLMPFEAVRKLYLFEILIDESS